MSRRSRHSGLRGDCHSAERREALRRIGAASAMSAVSPTFPSEAMAQNKTRSLPSTIKEVGKRFRNRSLGVTELVKSCLNGAKQLGPKLNPFITLTEEEALKTAGCCLLSHDPPGAENKALFGPVVHANMEQAEKIRKDAYQAAIEQRPKEIAEIREVFKDVDAFLTPTHPFVAPPFTVDAEADRGVRQFTVPVSFTGFPAISLPCGFSSLGLPIGLQIVANDSQEQLLFRIAGAFEQDTDFHLRRPSIYWNGRA